MQGDVHPPGEGDNPDPIDDMAGIGERARSLNLKGCAPVLIAAVVLITDLHRRDQQPRRRLGQAVGDAPSTAASETPSETPSRDPVETRASHPARRPARQPARQPSPSAAASTPGEGTPPGSRRYEGKSGDQIGCITCDGLSRYLSVEHPGVGVGDGARPKLEVVWPENGSFTEFGATVSGPNQGRYGFAVLANGTSYTAGCAMEIGQTSCQAPSSAKIKKGDRVAIIIGEGGHHGERQTREQWGLHRQLVVRLPARWRLTQRPRRMTRLTSRSWSSTTRSAPEPGPQGADAVQPEHRRRGGGRGADHVLDRRGRRPGRRTSPRAAMVSVEPAMAPVSASRATPSRTCTVDRAEPVVAVGRGRAAAIASVTSTAGAAWRRRGQPQHGRVEVHAVGDQLDVRVGVLERAPRPGRARGGAAAHRVEQVRADAWRRRRARRAPRRTSRRCGRARRSRRRWPARRTASRPPGSSGARVTIRSVAARRRRPASSTWPGVGCVSSAGSCAPAGSARATAPRGGGRPAVRRRPAAPARAPGVSSRSGASVTRLATIVVVPCARWAPDHGLGRLGGAGVEGRAAAAVHVRVDEARARASRRSAPRPAAPAASAGTDVRDPLAVDVHPPRREDPRRGDHTVCGDGHVRHVRLVVSASTSDSSSSSSRPGVLRFHHRITKRNEEVVDGRVAEPDHDQQQRLGRDVEVEQVVEQAGGEPEPVLDVRAR